MQGYFLEGDLGGVAGIAGLLHEQLGAAGFELGSFEIEGELILVDPEDAFGAREVEAGLLELFEQVGHDELGEDLALFGLFALVDEDGAQFAVDGEGERLPTERGDFGDDLEAVFDGAAGDGIPFLLRGHRRGPGCGRGDGAYGGEAAGERECENGQE